MDTHGIHWSMAQRGLMNLCGYDWKVIGSEQHVMFQCPFVIGCAMTSFRKYGPGTSTNISVGQNDWANIIHKTASNPYSLMHGVQVQVRLAYFAEVMATYTEAENGYIDWEHNKTIPEMRDKAFMGQYKTNASLHRFGCWLEPKSPKPQQPMFMPPAPKAWNRPASSSTSR